MPFDPTKLYDDKLPFVYFNQKTISNLSDRLVSDPNLSKQPYFVQPVGLIVTSLRRLCPAVCGCLVPVPRIQGDKEHIQSRGTHCDSEGYV